MDQVYVILYKSILGDLKYLPLLDKGALESQIKLEYHILVELSD